MRANPVKDIVSCALFLKDPALQDKTVWRIFIARFFKEYRGVILGYFELEQEADNKPSLIRLNNQEMFLTVMSALADRDVFDCDKKALARVLYDTFELNLRFTSLVQYLCQRNSESNDFLYNLTNRKKSNNWE